MRKETLLAILAGIAIGLIFGFSAWKGTQLLKRNTGNENPKVKQTPLPKNSFIINLDNLTNDSVILENPVTITGLTKPLVDIVVSTENEDYFTKSTDVGSFSFDVEVPSGLSELKISAFDENGNSTEQKLTLVYSSEFAKSLESADGEVSTSEGNSITQIKEDEKPAAFVGTITDITSQTIQIKSESGEILQASTNDETTFVNLLKKAAEVKSTDLAIGDYVVALGFLNSKSVLNTKRVLITSKAAPNVFVPLWGKISEITKKAISITKQDESSQEILLPKKWKGPNISELEVEQNIIFVGSTVDEVYTLRSLYSPVR